MAEVSQLRGDQLLPPDVEAAIAALAARQEMVVALRQLKDLGFSKQTIAKRCDAGRLFRQHRATYSLVPRITRRGEFFAAVLACGPEAALSHLSAGHEHEVRRHLWGDVHVVVPTRGPKSRLGIIVHSARALDDAVVTRNGLRITNVQRTLTDLADVLTPVALQSAVSAAERKQLIHRNTFVPLPGRRSPFTRPHLFTRSQNERQLKSLCEQFGIDTPEFNVQVGRWEVDALWPGLALEIDAWHTHGDPVAFERDRFKNEDLELNHGLMVRRITDTRLHYEPEVVASVIRRSLAACGTTAARWSAAG